MKHTDAIEIVIPIDHNKYYYFVFLLSCYDYHGYPIIIYLYD